jgi:hypothetical protein
MILYVFKLSSKLKVQGWYQVIHYFSNHETNVIAQFHYKYKDAAKTMSLLILDTASSNFSSSSVSPIDLAASINCWRTSSSLLIALIYKSKKNSLFFQTLEMTRANEKIQSVVTIVFLV